MLLLLRRHAKKIKLADLIEGLFTSQFYGNSSDIMVLLGIIAKGIFQ